MIRRAFTHGRSAVSLCAARATDPIKPAAEDGWGASTTLILGAVSIALLAAFVAREAKAATPLMPLRMFRSRNVTGANLIQVLTVAGMFGMFFLGSLYLQRVLGYDALHIGLAFLPVTIVMGTLSLRYSEKLIQRFGARTMQFPGLGLMVAGMVLFAQTPVDGSYVRDVLPALLLTGTGVGLCFPALMGLAMSGATPSDAGLASGLVNTAAQVGAALGLAVLVRAPGPVVRDGRVKSRRRRISFPPASTRGGLSL